MRVMDRSTRPQPLAVEIEVSPAYELITSLSVFCEQEYHDTLEVGREWLDGIRATASPDLLEDIQRFHAGFDKIGIFLWGLVYESAAPKEIACFFSHLRAVDPLDLRLGLLDNPELPREAIERAARGDHDALRQCLATVADDHCGEKRAAYQYHLPLDLEADKQQLLSILTRWHEQVFRHQEARLTAILERDAAAKRKLARTHPPEQLIELATNGLRYIPEPGIARVLLIPTVVFRPWVLIGSYRDAKIFCYGVADESLTETASPSPDGLIKIYKALADERRLQAMRRLATRTYTLQELADELGMGKSLMHHHMVTLRAAGLVRVSIGGERRYELRPETLAALPEMLGAFLGQPDNAEIASAPKQGHPAPTDPHRAHSLPSDP